MFVGYGMADAAVGYDDYQDLDVRGKIAVVLYGFPKGMDSEIGAHLMSQQAVRRGPWRDRHHFAADPRDIVDPPVEPGEAFPRAPGNVVGPKRRDAVQSG